MLLMSWRIRRLHAQQKRKALQMLALSGVVRQSNVDLRYPTPITISGTLTAPETQSSSDERPIPPIPESSPQSPIR